MANNDKNKHISTSTALDDEQRVKVLSPGMLVAKRFFRNRLAVAGMIILIAMFIFSFIGGMLMPYGETQVFKIYDSIEKDFAGAAVSTEYQYYNAEGESLPAVAKSKLILAINKGEDSFVAKDVTYSLIKEGNEFYRIVQYQDVAKIANLRGIDRISPVEGETFTKEMENLYMKAQNEGKDTFEFNGTTYYILKNGKKGSIAKAKEICLISKINFNAFSKDTVIDYNFRYAAEKAMNEKQTTFEVNGSVYEMDLNEEDNTAVFYLKQDNQRIEYAIASNMSINAVGGEFLSIDFREAVLKAIENGDTSFVFPDESGAEIEYKLVRKNNQYIIRKYTETELIDVYEKPSLKRHLLGTDGSGMDVLTRLMYGGRISLMIGFLVVVIETIIGVILGGVAGYFGGWIDNLIMRLVDIVYCIPAIPLYIIIGSVMETLKIDPKIRIFILMIILGLLGWPGIARMVRGQILSLREQEFMTATEALGISTRRRIFKHLVPNVIPQITVIATMDLGNVILTEATLSFFGIGVKFPYASWGNIINAVNDIYVMTNYWFVWIPAGLLILITVLGFNFVGDGLRDAFDPKMKR